MSTKDHYLYDYNLWEGTFSLFNSYHLLSSNETKLLFLQKIYATSYRIILSTGFYISLNAKYYAIFLVSILEHVLLRQFEKENCANLILCIQNLENKIIEITDRPSYSKHAFQTSPFKGT